VTPAGRELSWWTERTCLPGLTPWLKTSMSLSFLQAPILSQALRGIPGSYLQESHSEPLYLTPEQDNSNQVHHVHRASNFMAQ
jgi:hypothetical protein